MQIIVFIKHGIKNFTYLGNKYLNFMFLCISCNTTRSKIRIMDKINGLVGGLMYDIWHVGYRIADRLNINVTILNYIKKTDRNYYIIYYPSKI